MFILLSFFMLNLDESWNKLSSFFLFRLQQNHFQRCFLGILQNPIKPYPPILLTGEGRLVQRQRFITILFIPRHGRQYWILLYLKIQLFGQVWNLLRFFNRQLVIRKTILYQLVTIPCKLFNHLPDIFLYVTIKTTLILTFVFVSFKIFL